MCWGWRYPGDVGNSVLLVSAGPSSSNNLGHIKPVFINVVHASAQSQSATGYVNHVSSSDAVILFEWLQLESIVLVIS